MRTVVPNTVVDEPEEVIEPLEYVQQSEPQEIIEPELVVPETTSTAVSTVAKATPLKKTGVLSGIGASILSALSNI